jgi:hypothetical protein
MFLQQVSCEPSAVVRTDTLWDLLAAAVVSFHMAKILYIELLLQLATRPDSTSIDCAMTSHDRDNLSHKIHSHALSIASICLSSGTAESVFPVAVNPLFYGESKQAMHV